MSEQQIVEFVDLLDHPDYEILTVFPFTIRRKSNHYEVIEGFDKDGYLRLNLNDSFGIKTYKKHILIAKQFIPNDDPEHKNQVDHRNRIRDDNHLENLRCTSSENCFNTSYLIHYLLMIPPRPILLVLADFFYSLAEILTSKIFGPGPKGPGPIISKSYYDY